MTSSVRVRMYNEGSQSIRKSLETNLGKKDNLCVINLFAYRFQQTDRLSLINVLVFVHKIRFIFALKLIKCPLNMSHCDMPKLARYTGCSISVIRPRSTGQKPRYANMATDRGAMTVASQVPFHDICSLLEKIHSNKGTDKKKGILKSFIGSWRETHNKIHGDAKTVSAAMYIEIGLIMKLGRYMRNPNITLTVTVTRV